MSLILILHPSTFDELIPNIACNKGVALLVVVTEAPIKSVRMIVDFVPDGGGEGDDGRGFG